MSRTSRSATGTSARRPAEASGPCGPRRHPEAVRGGWSPVRLLPFAGFCRLLGRSATARRRPRRLGPGACRRRSSAESGRSRSASCSGRCRVATSCSSRSRRSGSAAATSTTTSKGRSARRWSSRASCPATSSPAVSSPGAAATTASQPARSWRSIPRHPVARANGATAATSISAPTWSSRAPRPIRAPWRESSPSGPRRSSRSPTVSMRPMRRCSSPWAWPSMRSTSPSRACSRPVPSSAAAPSVSWRCRSPGSPASAR